MLARSVARSALRGSNASSIILRPAVAVSQSRSSTTSTDAAQKILEKQRLNRPISPHLNIYKPQITWVLSSLNRITGVALSAGAYGFFAAYAVSPLFGWHLESVAVAEAFGSLPEIVKGLVKTTLALPFTFHAFAGIRHLIWDTGRMLTNKGVITTGWATVGLTAVASLYLGFFL